MTAPLSPREMKKKVERFSQIHDMNGAAHPWNNSGVG
jgi:hypothetical protein